MVFIYVLHLFLLIVFLSLFHSFIHSFIYLFIYLFICYPIFIMYELLPFYANEIYRLSVL